MSFLLYLPDPDKACEVVSDASLLGVGAGLLHDKHPIAFYSRKFSPAERNYTTGEQELFGVICALKETNPQMSACIIMADTAAVAHVDLLDTMTLLHEFAEGESIFISPSLTDQTPDPTPCPIKVFYDPPCTKQCLGVGIDIAEFDAVVNGARTTAAMDSAASDCFVTASAVHRIGLIQNPCPIFKVQVANGPPVMIRTVCTLQVRIQDHKSVVRAYVLPDGLSTVDLLLGRTWLGEYRANLDFSPKHVWARLHTRGGKQTVVKSRSRASRDCSPHDVVAYAAREDL